MTGEKDVPHGVTAQEDDSWEPSVEHAHAAFERALHGFGHASAGQDDTSAGQLVRLASRRGGQGRCRVR